MSLETLCKVLNFFMGMLAMYLVQIGWKRFRRRRHDLPVPRWGRRAALLVAVVVVVAGSFLLGLQTHNTQRQVRDISLQMQRCQRELFSALIARSAISMENDQQSRKQRDAFAKSDDAMATWIGTLLSPPPQIAALAPDDPRRREWGIAVTQPFNDALADSRRVVAESRAQELANDAERLQHPIPQPTCGQ